MRISYVTLCGCLIACGAASVGLLACSDSDDPNPTRAVDAGVDTGKTDGGARPVDSGVPTDDSSAQPDATTDGTVAEGGRDGGEGGTVGANTTKETAEAIDSKGAQVVGRVADPKTSSAWYKFEGKADETYIILTDSKADGVDGDAPEYLDPVVELYDSTGTTPIAMQDDPSPRTGTDVELFFVLPKDGTYYIRLADCNAHFTSCAPANGIKHTEFELTLAPFNMLTSFAVDKEPNNEIATATPLTYKLVDGETFYHTLNVGGVYVPADTDVDVYSFTVPAALKVQTGDRPTAEFYLQTPGAAGNGSPTSIGTISVSDGTSTLASFDAAKLFAAKDLPTLSVPVEVGKTYYLTSKNGTATAGYYFFRSTVSGGNPVEKSTDNHVIDKAEALSGDPKTGKYFLDANVTVGETDFFSVAVPTGSKSFGASCFAQTLGSGLQGLVLEATQADGTAIANAKATETEVEGASFKGIAVPAGQTRLIMKVSATSQAKDVTGTHYRCLFAFSLTK